jgi:heme oxygenase
VDDGAREQLAVLTAGPAGYHAWAQEYYEVALSLADVEAVFRHEPLTDALAKRLNPRIDMAKLRTDLAEIGYPATDSRASR